MDDRFDFNDGIGLVPAHKHPNGGGWVADTAIVAASVWVGPYCRVYGNARVFDDVRIAGNAMVFDNAYVSANVLIMNNAKVFGNAFVRGNAKVYDDAQVFGKVRVYDNAKVFGYANLYDRLVVHGNAVIHTTPYRAVRTDGYNFIIVPDNNNIPRIIAGCRYFTLEEARDHWTKTRGGTPLGDETMDIIDYLEKRFKRTKYDDNV